MEVNTFLTKLKGLIKKISRSSNTQIESHTLTCHHLVSRLIKNDEILASMNGPKLRLLAYEAILYLVQVLDLKNGPAKCSQSPDQKGKIAVYLGDINSTLIEVKELLKRCQRDSLNNGRKSFLPSNEMTTKLDKNLNQYSSRLSAIMTQIEKQKNHPIHSQASLTSLSQSKDNQRQDENYGIVIEQMSRVLQKKQKRIAELENQLKQSQISIKQAQINFSNHQNLFNQKQNELLRELLQITTRNKQLELQFEHKVQLILRETKRQTKRRLKLDKSTLNLKIQNEKYDNNNFSLTNKALQGLTDETIPSICLFNHISNSQRKPSLQRISSAKSFRRYGNFEQKERGFTVQKRVRQMMDRNDDLYLLMLCQASTIEEIL